MLKILCTQNGMDYVHFFFLLTFLKEPFLLASKNFVSQQIHVEGNLQPLWTFISSSEKCSSSRFAGMLCRFYLMGVKPSAVFTAWHKLDLTLHGWRGSISFNGEPWVQTFVKGSDLSFAWITFLNHMICMEILSLLIFTLILASTHWNVLVIPTICLTALPPFGRIEQSRTHFWKGNEWRHVGALLLWGGSLLVTTGNSNFCLQALVLCCESCFLGQWDDILGSGVEAFVRKLGD